MAGRPFCIPMPRCRVSRKSWILLWWVNLCGGDRRLSMCASTSLPLSFLILLALDNSKEKGKQILSFLNVEQELTLQGYGRRVKVLRHPQEKLLLEEFVSLGRMMQEMTVMDYKEPGANTNPRSAPLITSPPPSPPLPSQH